MTSRVSRWGCLAILAISNLVLWVVVAIAVGLVASDTVDLGMETYIRERRATAETLIQQVPTWISELKARPATQEPEPAEVQAEKGSPTSTSISPTAPQPSPPPATQAPQTPTAPPAQEPSTPPTPTPISSSPSATPLSPSAVPSAPSATPGPSATPISSPLLMSNPDLLTLLNIDAEMLRSATGRPVQIRYREGPLNREIATFLEAHPNLPYRNLYIALKRDHIILTGEVTTQGFQLSAEVIGTLAAEDCRFVVEIEAISTTGTLPPVLYESPIENMLEDAMNWIPTEYPLCLEQIVLEEGRMTIYASRR
jgi:hypothetical protein